MRLINTNLLNYFYKNGVKPLIGNIAKKLDVSKLANNLLTTVTGYAMDARQGPVIQGQIDDVRADVTAINGKLILKPKEISLQIPEKAITSHGYANSNITFNTPEGYTPSSIRGYNLTSSYATVYKLSLTDSHVAIGLGNTSSNAITVSGSVTVLFTPQF